MFKLGLYAGITCAILWILFDIIYLNRWKIFKGLNKWMKHSYRRSIILNIAIGTGFLGILAKALDMGNALIATIIVFILVTMYNTILVTKNKTINAISRRR